MGVWVGLRIPALEWPAGPAAGADSSALPAQESVHFVRGLSHPSSAPRWQGIVDLTAGWRSRWPSMQQGSSAAALTIINSRDILLQSIAAELAQKAHVQHEV